MILRELFNNPKTLKEFQDDPKKIKQANPEELKFGSSPDEADKDNIFNYKGIFPDMKLLAIRAREEFPVATNDLEAILKYLNAHRVEGEREMSELERENDQQEQLIKTLLRTEETFKQQLEQDEAFEQTLKAELNRQHEMDIQLRKVVQALLDKEKRFAEYAAQMAKAHPDDRSSQWDIMAQDIATGKIDPGLGQRHL